ncbi:MAG: helix-hairpin-helix domain-containing protein [Porphyromonadaceae bacterium]|nr:helix-hairpin-helix domain-containing protein [Porphyromonadaceae bacterium]
MRKYLITVILIASSAFTFSQDTNQNFEQIIENITNYIRDEGEEENIDIDLLYDDLSYFYETKINLNTATKEQLKRLQLLSDIQIENILSYVYLTKEMKSIYELQLVDGIDFFILQMLLPFVDIKPDETESYKWIQQDIFRRMRHEVFARADIPIEQKRGYAEQQYLGSPLYGQLRYKFKAGSRIQAGFTAEKDAGEQFWGSYNKGFDSYSTYVQLDKLWKFRRIVIGDFRATFGQGLIMNGAFYASKSSYVLKVTPAQNGLTRKASSDEYNFFKGIGATIDFKNLSITALYSFRYFDATIDTATNTITSIYTGGLFRRPNDWEKRNALSTQTIAANFNYRLNCFRIGATLYGNMLSAPINPSNEPYKLYAFRGQTQAAASLDYYCNIDKFTLFGETSITDQSAIATINGIGFMPVSIVSMVLLHRYYSPRYDLFFAKAFGKSSKVGNENGVYWGAEINPIKKWKISAYIDMFTFPYLKYDASAPSKGFDALLQVDFMPARNVSMYIRSKYNDKEKNFYNELFPTHQIANYQRHSVRYNINYTANNFVFRSIVETNFAHSPNMPVGNGFALVQDIGYNTNWHNLSINVHYVFFDAKDFENRLYFYERDVPYSMFTPMLYGVGNRYCINLKVDLLSRLTLYLRFAQTIYADKRNVISSGLEEIKGNIKSDFKLAIKWNFNYYRKN